MHIKSKCFGSKRCFFLQFQVLYTVYVVIEATKKMIGFVLLTFSMQLVQPKKTFFLAVILTSSP